MLYLILILGIILFTISLAYIDRYLIAWIGLLLSTITLALSLSAIQNRIDNDFKVSCLESKGVVMETQLGGLGCVYLEDNPNVR